MERKPNAFDETLKILMVEDSPYDAELVEVCLTESYPKLSVGRVYMAHTLIKTLQESPPHLILSDYSMPGFSGLEALDICKVHAPEIPFIFVSGTIGEERAVEALRNGATDYVLKQNLTRLPHAVHQALNIHRERRHKKRQQEELAKAYELLNSVFDTTHMMVAYLDCDFNFIQVNRAYAQANGNTVQYFSGKNYFHLFPASKRRPMFDNVVHSGRACFKYADRPDAIDSLDDGRIDWSMAPTTSYGVVEGLVLTEMDVTEQKKAEKERDDLLRTLEARVKHRTEQLTSLNDLLNEKNKDITDSIHYAKYIQEAFIPPVEKLRIGTTDAFMFNLPKDILSGDFYWKHHCDRNNCTYVAMGDCTGHGVPGSLMTILAVQLLDRHIQGCTEKKDPSSVLHDIDRSIIKFLRQEETTTALNDGMEIILIRIDHAQHHICFSSAGIPLYHFVEDQMNRYKLTKHSVGGHANGRTKKFENCEFTYSPGERVYAFSDGYVDQFGGQHGSKMLRKRKEAVLRKMQTDPFAAHHEMLYAFFTAWKGNHDQVDDVMAIGLEL